MNPIEVKFDCYNWWGNKIYRTKRNTPIVHIENEGFYVLTDSSDIDSDPYKKLKDDAIKVVEDDKSSFVVEPYSFAPNLWAVKYKGKYIYCNVYKSKCYQYIADNSKRYESRY